MRDYLVGNDGSAHANVTLTSCAAAARSTPEAHDGVKQSEQRSQLSEQPQQGGHAERYRKHDDDYKKVSCFPGCLCYSRCPREIVHRERVTLGGIKMSNQICRQRPRAVAVNYMARLSSAPARPCTVRQTAEIKGTHRPQILLINDTNRCVHMASLTLPLATTNTPHARCCTVAR